MNKAVHVELKLKECKVGRVGPFTFAHVIDENGNEATGIAKLSFLNNDLPSKGEEIAVGRARKALLLKKGHHRVQQNYMG